jgi:hypothetical protein
MQQWPPRCFAAMKKAPAMGRNRGKLCHQYECFNKIRTHDFTAGSALFRQVKWYVTFAESPLVLGISPLRSFATR